MKTFIAAIAATAGLLVASQAGAVVLINQDFEHVTDPMNPGFFTEYSYRTGQHNGSGDADSMYGEGTWTINTNPNATHDLWIETTFDSNKLILNGKAQGANVPNTFAWQQAATVNPGRFAYSIDIFDVCCNQHFTDIGGQNADSILTFDYQINGGAFIEITHVTTHITQISFSEAGALGYRVTGTFDIADFNPAPGQLQVSVRSWNGAAGGNDFAIDNILVASIPEPATWGLMLLGFGAAGAGLRARRRLAAAA